MARGAKPTGRRAGRPADSDVRIDIDLGEAARQAERITAWLAALRRRHDLARFEYTRLVRIVPAGPTYSHPILTLGTRFTETEDQLLATYLHEQMHWYLSEFGGRDHDPVEPFFDELVRRYPDAPIRLPEGARSFEQTYVHLVVCWLELAATEQFIGRERARALAATQWGYRWIYRTVIRDWEALEALFTRHGLVPILPPGVVNAARRRTRATTPPPRSLKSRRRPPGRGGRSVD